MDRCDVRAAIAPGSAMVMSKLWSVGGVAAVAIAAGTLGMPAVAAPMKGE